ncbi:MAG: hypothetical protein OHK0029_38840 [Armatimonadaceae bacterium]
MPSPTPSLTSTETRESPEDTPAFPATTRTLALRPAEFAVGGIHLTRFPVENRHHTALHIRLRIPDEFREWLSTTPDELALGPGESQLISLHTDIGKARHAVRTGSSPNGYVELVYRRLHPASRGMAPETPHTGTVQVRLPFASCPNCKRSLESAMASGEIELVPEYCPYCFERLRPCPVCGTLNSWLATRCILDEQHVLRKGPDWGTLGGSPAHEGSVEEKGIPTLTRRWSFPTVPPARREARLVWSAPVSAYGLVAAAAATYDGEAHLYAFDIRNGAPLWDAYPLPDPVYPDRGGAALADGRLYAATVEGVCVAVDAQRGTRTWETSVAGRVYGAVVPAGGTGLLLVTAVREDNTGTLYLLHRESGEVRGSIALPGPPDTAPAYAQGMAFTHDDRGNICGVDLETREIRWKKPCDEGFDAAPVVRDGLVFSISSGGTAWCHQAESGEEVWQVAVTNAPFAGTPAHDGPLLYMPANDGLHLFSASAGKAVRRYPQRMPVRSAPIVAGGTVFFGGTDGIIYGASAGRPLEKLYETTGIGSQLVAAPALSDDTLFFAATNGVLYALMQIPPLPPGPSPEGGRPVGN